MNMTYCCRKASEFGSLDLPLTWVRENGHEKILFLTIENYTETHGTRKRFSRSRRPARATGRRTLAASAPFLLHPSTMPLPEDVSGCSRGAQGRQWRNPHPLARGAAASAAIPSLSSSACAGPSQSPIPSRSLSTLGGGGGWRP
jgi:hypothetical protein